MVEIWHNPKCSKSRQALALLEERGIGPQVVHYLETPPSAERLTEVLGLLGVGARALLRRGEASYESLGLAAVTSEAELVAAMAKHPELIERPVVIARERAVIGRPPERVLEVLTQG